jgi:hypothetical protein
VRLCSSGALVVMSWALVHGAGAAPAALPVARVHLVGAGDGQTALDKRLHDLLDDEVAGLTVDSSPSFGGDEPLRMDAESGAPAVWLILEGTHARVRAAGAGRTRFVFRDLEVGEPLSEFDRERLGQSVKAALTTLVSGSPGALSRADAVAASGAPLVERAPPTPLAPAPPPRPPELRFRLGAFYQVEATGSGMFHGPGLIATLSNSGRAHEPELWLAAGYDVPGDFGNQLGSLTISTLWARVGLGLRLNDAVRLGLGAGIDRQTSRLVYIVGGTPGYPTNSDDRIFAVGRLLVRAGPTRLAGVDVSLTAFVELCRSSHFEMYVSQTNGEILETLYQSNVIQPGFSLDLWWP